MSDSDEIEMTEVAPPKKVVTSKHFAAEAGAAGAAAPPKRKPAKKVVESEEESDGSDYEGEASESEGAEAPRARGTLRACALRAPRAHRSFLRREAQGEEGGEGRARAEEGEECAAPPSADTSRSSCSR